ncbi:hypothetical protein ACX5K5_02095 [Glutamicibacter bergerei]
MPLADFADALILPQVLIAKPDWPVTRFGELEPGVTQCEEHLSASRVIPENSHKFTVAKEEAILIIYNKLITKGYSSAIWQILHR